MIDSVIIPVNLHFDVEKIVEVYQTVKGSVKESWDHQVSITSLSGTDLTEGIGKLNDLSHPEKDYGTLNYKFKNTYLEYLHNTLLETFPVVRGRIMLLEGKTCYTYHRDPTWRLHVPVISSNDSIFVIEDKVYRMPTLGQVYLVNTRLFHSAINMKDEDRVHLVYGLNSDDPLGLINDNLRN